ncbi:fimbrial protein [Escherichia coli]|nr:fimbrial protein [Escherichia coli]EHH5066602.1 fimbrial protein [Escherichia coli]EID8805984.1 fimbrial protein [Escherichia coli]
MQQLSFLPGEMTPGERSLIQRALKTLDRHLHEPGVAFTSTRAAREWLLLNMAGLEREEFRVLYLNNQNQLIAGETLFTGTINRTEVHPREVIKRALHHNAAAVVLAHNHPSGEVTPSKADRLITERLVQALGLVDTTVATKAAVAFLGTAIDATHTDVLALQSSAAGSATNVGVQILDRTGAALALDGATFSSETTLNNGTNTIPFQARYFATGAATPGAANADATFKVQYQ